ncbi:mycothiol transferase [Cellulomonas fengjieae]|uniref:mycothiol transferase n=1 Tax=Cellulomonas fengjieae TaxID=2819978 RepID=UPI001AAE35B2|nr:DUF664 domain-containing protein [Cellulomonas fengjieae]MBO3101499.1 DUF664 domain-containing protein [Cellulomonas fengjieae]
MTTTEPWYTPIAATEVEHLVGSLDLLRTTFRWKADDLDSAGLAHRIGSSSLTLGGLLKHLAAVEDTTFTWKLAGRHPGPMWRPETWGDTGAELLTAGDDTPEQLYATWDEAVARSRDRLEAALSGGGLDQLVEDSDDAGNHVNLRRLLLDLIQEYGRHTGHADLLREDVDGRVGEDPPSGWRPAVGARLTWIRDF